MVYRGYDVFDIIPDRNDDTELWSRSFEIIGSPAGKFSLDDRGGTPVIGRTWTYIATSRAEIAAVRTFLDSRIGKKVAFWIPTYLEDFTLTANASGTTATVEEVGYVARYVTDVARQHVAFISTAGVITPRKVNSAVNNGNGTETLTLDSALPGTFTPALTLLSFLVFARLDSDEYTVTWHTHNAAEFSLRILELPREVP